MQRGVREAAAEQDFGTVPRVLETPEGRSGEEPGRGSRQRERQGRKEKGFPGALSESAQSCPTLCDPVDCTVYGVLQARILEWVAIPSSRGSSQPRDRTQVSRTAGRFFPS